MFFKNFKLNDDLTKFYGEKPAGYDNFAPRLEEAGFIFINAAELTSGSSSSTVSLDDLEKVLFYLDTTSITLRDEIYMPLTDKPVN